VRRLRLALPLLLAWPLASCGGTTRGDVLRFLFDDPPGDRDTVSAESPATPVPADGEGEAIAAAEAGAGAPPAAGGIVRHSPYEDRDCGACHELGGSFSFRGNGVTVPAGSDHGEPGFGARLRVPRDRVCTECHDDMTEDALEQTGEYVHSPAGEGECLECHDPHQSRFPALLRFGDPLETVCFRCHDAGDVLSEEPHDGLAAAERTCTRCHDPHVSAREYLLKAAVAEGGGA